MDNTYKKVFASLGKVFRLSYNQLSAFCSLPVFLPDEIGRYHHDINILKGTAPGTDLCLNLLFVKNIDDLFHFICIKRN